MDDVRPDNLNPEELLSAYLDGEVTADQRAQVEQMLASDPEARAALEELRALSNALQSLPKLSVGEDLSERILRRAERAMLERQTLDPVVAPAAAQQVSPAAKPVSAPNTSQDQSPSLLERGSQGAGWARRLAWPLAAVAATVLIMLVSQKQKPELALAPVNAPQATPHANDSNDAVMHSAPETEASEAASRDGFVAGKGAFEDADHFSNRADQDGTAFKQSARSDTQQQVQELNSPVESEFGSNAVHSKMQTARSAELDQTKSAGGDQNSERQLQAGPAATLARAAQAKAGQTNSGPVPGEQAGGGTGGGGKLPAAPSSVEELAAAAAPAAGAGFSRVPVADAMPARQQAAEANRRVELVVELTGPDEAAEIEAFNQLLVMQNIRVEDYASHSRRKQLAQDKLAQDESEFKAREAEPIVPSKSLANGEAPKQAATRPQAGEKREAATPESKLAEMKEKAKKSADQDLEPELPVAAQPTTPLGVRGNQQGKPAEEPAKAPATAGLAQIDRERLAKPSSESDGEGADLAGGIVGGRRSAEVELVLVTATPAQVRDLLKEINDRSTQYRALPLEIAQHRQLAEDRSANLQDKKADQDNRDAPLELLNAKRADEDASPQSPPVAEEAKSLGSDQFDQGYAIRWRVREDQLASLLTQDALNQLEDQGRSHGSEAKPGWESGDGVAQTEEIVDGQKLELQVGPNELADTPADSSLRSETGEGANKKASEEKTQPATKPQAEPSPVPVPAGEMKKNELKSPIRADAQDERRKNPSFATEKEESEKPGSRPQAANARDPLFDDEPIVNQQRRAREGEQFRGAAENEQIRVLFVLRRGTAANQQSSSEVTGKAAPTVQPNASDPAPAAESAPANPEPAKE